MSETLWAEYGCGRRFLARLPQDQDLLTSIEEFCQSASVPMAVFSMAGTVSSVSFGTYDYKQQVYVTCTEPAPFEIVSCTGNVSLKDGHPYGLAHGVFADEHGKIIGGRIFSDTILLVAELDLQELEGEPLQRIYDPKTGLYLWKIREE